MKMKWIIIYKGLKSVLDIVTDMQKYLRIGIYTFIN